MKAFTHTFLNIALGTLICSAAPALLAQSQPIQGIVRDPQSAVIVGARISCTDPRAGVEAVTDPEGHFSFDPSRCTGNELRVSAKGFASRLVPPNKPDANLEIVLEPSAVDAVVTVSGMSSSIADSPNSIRTVAPEELANPGAAALDEGLRQVPGFTLFRRTSSRTANPTSQGVSLRGVGGSGASRAVVLVDGIPMNDPFGGWVYWGRVPFESIDEVEILRGPGSDQYGSSALGGVVSIRTRRPPQGLFSSVDLSYGGMRTPSFSSFSSATTNRIAGSLSADFFSTDGYIPVVRTSRGSVDTKANVRRTAIQPEVTATFGTNGRVFAKGEYYDEVRANGTYLQSNDTRLKSLRAGVDSELGEAGSIGARFFALEQEYHQSFSSISADRSSESLSRLQRVPSRAIGLNARWTKQWQNYSVFAGSEFRRTSGSSDETGFAGGNATSRTETGGVQLTKAAFAGGRLIRGGLTLNGTLRYDRIDERSGHSVSRSVSGSILSNTTFPERLSSSLTGRGSALFRLSDHVALSAAFATGFREPTLNELYRGFRLGNVLTLPNEALRPERARDVESAVTFTGLSDRLYARAGAYCVAITDAISNLTLSVTPSLITRKRGNLDRSRSCGIESEIKIIFSPSLSISADHLFVNSVVTASAGDPSASGRRVPQVARNQFSAQAIYTRPRVGTLHLQVRASGMQFDDDQNAFPLRSYFVVGALYSRRIHRNIDIYAAVENAFDTQVDAARTPILSLGQPRTARIGLRLKFGRGK